jgi:hypothetical protein
MPDLVQTFRLAKVDVPKNRRFNNAVTELGAAEVRPAEVNGSGGPPCC